MAIYFVRHAQDDKRYRGGFSQLGLVESGLKQAQQLGDYLQSHREELDIQLLIGSDLKRAVQTTTEVERGLQLTATFSDKWREIDNGLLAGMLNTEALEKYPNLFFNTLRMDESYPEGESPQAFYDRIKVVFYELVNCDAFKHQNVMIVTHSGVINIIYYLVRELEWSNQSPNLNEISCASIHKLDETAKRIDILN